MKEQKIVVIAAGIVEKDGKFLISQRHPLSHFGGGEWEFPGGKIDFGEHPEETVVRELKEELGIDTKVKDLLMIHTQGYENETQARHVILHIYRLELIAGEPNKVEATDLAWITLDDLPRYTFVKSMDGILPTYRSHLLSQNAS